MKLPTVSTTPAHSSFCIGFVFSDISGAVDDLVRTKPGQIIRS
ncbi:MAG: hypothetical protein R3E09_15730 [Novosphingobium sp.]